MQMFEGVVGFLTRESGTVLTTGFKSVLDGNLVIRESRKILNLNQPTNGLLVIETRLLL